MGTHQKAVWAALILGAVLSDFAMAQGKQKPAVLSVDTIESIPSRIGFGSCANENKEQPVLNAVVKKDPDLFIYLGDNIYGDSKDMGVLAAKYRKLGAKKEFQDLRASVPVIATWDDHDYGWNDAGKDYVFKEESKQLFMDFWKVPVDSPRRKHPGIYGSHEFSNDKWKLQIILLDTRSFRDPLKRNPKNLPKDSPYKNDYQPDESNKTLLGDEQWKWLRSELEKESDMRVICSSIQFGHEYNGWESWTNLPKEQQRFIELIKETKANGVVFISGDVHWAEISKREFDDHYPLYDVTASGITEDWYNVEPNKYRVGNAFRKNHFGMLEIDWGQEDPTVSMQIIDVNGDVQIKHMVRLSEISNKQD